MTLTAQNSSMLIETYQPFSFSYTGQRANNEDTIWPLPSQANEQTRLFLVCDGMGGADKGEIASQLIVEEITRFVAANGFPLLDDSHLDAALSDVRTAFQTYMQAHLLINRMGSTMALLQLHEQGVTIAHIGDSRVFQVRDGFVIFQTIDHKQVNDMVESGIITAEQALTHPWRNRLSRAVVMNSDESQNPHFRFESPDVVLLTDVQPGDYFFLCSDGVLEQIDGQMLGAILKIDVADATKCQLLLQRCTNTVKDNYSGHLIRIKRIIQE